MKPHLRGKHPCWTCRLRKKKCDENRPGCSTCGLLSIECYGYGPKPDWVGDGAAEKVIMDDLKKIVKHTSRRKPTRSRPSQTPVVRLASKHSHGSPSSSSHSSGSNHLLHSNSPSDDASSLDVAAARHRLDGQSPQHDEDGITASLIMSPKQSTLLMLFLDKVFPLQYLMYKPDILNDGRGWLLAILLRTKPLYHAVLALASYYRLMTISAMVSPACRAVAMTQSENHLGLSLAELQEAMKLVDHLAGKKRAKYDTGTVFSIIQLVFFELFTGKDSTWRIHLNAVVEVYNQVFQDGLASLDSSERSKEIIRGDLPLRAEDVFVKQEVLAFRFMGGSILWLDIISSITTGTTPKLLQFHSDLTASSHTRLDDIMGCRNWVMVQIARIAAHQARRPKANGQTTLQQAESDFDASQIGVDIEYLQSSEDLGLINISEGLHHNAYEASRDDVAVITRAFADMASVYLHLVTYGFQNLEIIESTVVRALKMIRTQVPSSLLPTLVPPLYIIGCVVREGKDREYVRACFSSAPIKDPLFQHREKILATLEDIWSNRRSATAFSWDDALELSQDILLL
ncbi:fungal-specific transcription factor domain-containing protein [Xylariomycetidae sp. FL2044]|nr:fungal-specific transcription factor domain-containing protein [Xylariomycetidae sp. FL2044]